MRQRACLSSAVIAGSALRCDLVGTPPGFDRELRFHDQCRAAVPSTPAVPWLHEAVRFVSVGLTPSRFARASRALPSWMAKGCLDGVDGKCLFYRRT